MTATVVAGCLGGGGPESPGTDQPGGWVPTPERMHSDLDHVQTFSTAPATVEEFADSISGSTWEQYQTEWLDWEIADPEPADVERFTRGGDTNVGVGFGAVTHSLDGDVLRENLRSVGFEEADTYEGFDIFAGPDGNRARGLNGTRLAVGRHPTDATGVVETVVDTGLGNGDRYRDREELSDLVTALDTGGNFRFATFPRNDASVPADGVFRGSLARGYSLAPGEEFTGKRGEWFADDAGIPNEEMKQYVRSNPLFEGAANVELLTGENLGIIEYTIDPGTLSLNQLG